MTSIPGKISVCGFQESGIEWLSNIVRYMTETPCHHDTHQVHWQPVNVNSFVNLGPSACPVDVFLPNNKVVLVIRHPKDTAVATFIKDGYNDAWNFSDFSAQFFGETNSLGLSWTEYIVQWNGAIQQLGPGRVHVIYYNDLVTNLREELQKLYNYLGISPHSPLQSIEQLVSTCNYHNFFDRKEPDRKRRKLVQTKENIEFELHEVGLWKKYFTVKQNEDVNQALKRFADTDNIVSANWK